jgi:hypothetical protein
MFPARRHGLDQCSGRGLERKFLLRLAGLFGVIVGGELLGAAFCRALPSDTSRAEPRPISINLPRQR